MPALRTRRVGPHLSKGSELLFAYMKRTGETQATVARRCDLSAVVVLRALRGDRRLSWPTMSAFVVIGIPLEAWHEAPSKSFERRLIAVAA